MGAGTAAILLAGLAQVSLVAVAAEGPVGLGTAGSYSVLGGETVTSTGETRLAADLGVSPGTAIVGFPPGIVGGVAHAGNASAAQAKADLVIAYDDAAGRAPTASVAGDLVGRTLPAGVYSSTSTLALSGTLTLDAQGDPGSVFIFQVASALTTASASDVLLVNGAQACNVVWQVGSSATLGSGSTFAGSILALASVTVGTGADVEGRALARDGQVSLDAAVVRAPGCDTAPPTDPPTEDPTEPPTDDPTAPPTDDPTEPPTDDPTAPPTDEPTEDPTVPPTDEPTVPPTDEPTVPPTEEPTVPPTESPTEDPTTPPTEDPTVLPTDEPTVPATDGPTVPATDDPTVPATDDPTIPAAGTPRAPWTSTGTSTYAFPDTPTGSSIVHGRGEPELPSTGITGLAVALTGTAGLMLAGLLLVRRARLS